MGFLSKLVKIGEMASGINDAAEAVSRTTVEGFGPPAYSLYTALDLGNLHRKIDITHEQVMVAIVIQLEKMLEARRENESETSFSLGFGGNDEWYVQCMHIGSKQLC